MNIPTDNRLKSFHFDLGDSSTGPVGFSARIVARTPEAALARLKEYLPEDVSADDLLDSEEDEYIQVYLNANVVTVDDIYSWEYAEDLNFKDPGLTREERLKAIIAEACLPEDPYANDDLTGRVALLESSRENDWLTTHDSVEDAVEYHVTQEETHWTVERLVDLETGEEYEFDDEERTAALKN